MARKQSAQDVVSSSVAGVQAKVVTQLEDAKKRFITLEKEFVKRGREQQKELESLLKSVRGGAPLKQVEKSVNAASTEVKKRLDGLQGSVLGLLGAYAVRQLFVSRGWLFASTPEGTERRPFAALRRLFLRR